jgi:hypothetical protein
VIVKATLPSLVQDYLKGCSIVDLAKKMNYPPYLLARYVVEEVSSLSGGRKVLAKAMRDPEHCLGCVDAIMEVHRFTESSDAFQGTTRLAQQVEDATKADPLYGPIHDRDRHMVGVEYEVVLEFKLQSMGEM